MRYLVLFLVLFVTSCKFSDSHKKSTDPFFETIDLAKNGFVYDNVGLLDSIQKTQLSLVLKEHYKYYGIEVLCIVIPSFKEFGDEMRYTDYFLYNYDNNAARNLVIVILFSEDKKLFIRTNKRSAPYYPPEKCKAIMDTYMVPKFKEADFFEGFKEGINELIKIDTI